MREFMGREGVGRPSHNGKAEEGQLPHPLSSPASITDRLDASDDTVGAWILSGNLQHSRAADFGFQFWLSFFGSLVGSYRLPEHCFRFVSG